MRNYVSEMSVNEQMSNARSGKATALIIGTLFMLVIFAISSLTSCTSPSSQRDIEKNKRDLVEK
jgi:hypothetical protein